MKSPGMWVSLLIALAEPSFADGLVEDMWVVTSSEKGFSTDAAVLAKAVLWEDGVLPLKFAGSFSDAQKQQVLDACAEWSGVANVGCVVGEYKGRSVQVGQWIDGCWALWGMGNHLVIFGRMMNLADGCFNGRRTLLHELGHAFGLIHEHQRADRDAYITIDRDNVDGVFLDVNARIGFDPQQMKLETPYDFLSIMHYARKSYSRNGQDTIVPLPQYSQYIDVIGRVTSISPLDALAMRNAYGPPFESPIQLLTY